MDNSKGCMKTCIISFIAIYVFMMGYGFVVHGILLRADYEALASITRPMEEMQKLAPICWVLHALLAAVLVCLFKKFRKGMEVCNAAVGYTKCPIKSGGICFGMKIGVIFAVYMTSNYIWWPVPGELAIKWFVSEFILGVGIGAILGMICRTGSNCETKTV